MSMFNQETTYCILVGNIMEGITDIYGPFRTRGDALLYAESFLRDWAIAEMSNPNSDDDEGNDNDWTGFSDGDAE